MVSVVVLFIILFSMMLLVVHVFRVERRLDRYLSEGQLRNHRNTMKTAWQGIWYTLGEKSLQRMYVDLLQHDELTSLLTVSLAYCVPALFTALGLSGLHLPAWWWIMAAIFKPLQGALNAIVYFRPKYKSDRERCQRRDIPRSRFATVCRVLEVTKPRLPSVFSETNATTEMKASACVKSDDAVMAQNSAAVAQCSGSSVVDLESSIPQ